MPAGSILVADDDTAIRTVLNQALSRAGYEVRLTGNAATLWRWVSQGEGDLVITDVVMPDENAFDLLPRIKKMRPNLPVIVMSAQNTFMTAIRASERGAYEYLPKPFDLKELITIVGRALAEPNQHGGDSTRSDRVGIVRPRARRLHRCQHPRLRPLRAGRRRHTVPRRNRRYADGVERLKQHRWPGNVRELENLARRLAALYPQDVITGSVIDGELAPPAVASGGNAPLGVDNLGGAVEAYLSSHFSGFPNGVPPPGLYHRILKEIEVPLLTAALAATRGNQIRAADLLGLNRNTLRKKIRDLDIQVYRSGG
jgi:DNA-binding NtrC family response regulator